MTTDSLNGAESLAHADDGAYNGAAQPRAAQPPSRYRGGYFDPSKISEIVLYEDNQVMIYHN
jgi:hypothetical protein